ncbi:unnamed protein product [Somion occarium]|uniref:WD40 repeat-like protein n=1 Tax=Somion occarium TaxID=3059160 RepID=A0ABP1ECF5_9APHY
MSNEPWEQEIDSLKTQLSQFKELFLNQIAAKDYDSIKSDGLVDILKEASTLARRAEAQNDPDIDAIVQSVYELHKDGVDFAHGPADVFEYMPSFAHDDDASIVRDRHRTIGQGVMDSFFQFMAAYIKRKPDGSLPNPTPSPWKKARQPHPKTTPLSRFRRPFPVSANDETPLAQTIYQARCEIYGHNIHSPIKMEMSSGSSCLAIIGAGGWKNRDPKVTLYFLDELAENPLHDGEHFTPQLREPATEVVLDEGRKLLFVGDSDRVKSYCWEKDEEGKPFSPVHTLRSKKHDGPLAVHSNGRILRAGKGSALVWNIDDLETHREHNKIGEGQYDTSDTWRDEDARIEPSPGSQPHLTVDFPDPNFAIGTWHLHQPSGHMFCSESEINTTKWGCVEMDLQAGGRIVRRFLGHAGTVNQFSTSEADPNVVLTACDDGFVRMYDIRRSLPILTFDVEGQASRCYSALLTHPDGIPTVFTGGTRSEQVKVWDVRARRVVYELSSGNTAVQAMAWDTQHSTLYAATECMYIDRFGRTVGYRPAEKPNYREYTDEPSEKASDDESIGKSDDAEEGHEDAADDDEMEEGEDDDEMEEGEEEEEDAMEEGAQALEDDEDQMYQDASDDDEEDGDDYNQRRWPRKAHHGENFYGRVYDAAANMFFQYRFKADPDMDVMLSSGYATLDDGELW